MAQPSFSAGQQVGRYTIRKLLAQGGMAEVYKADQELTAGIFRPVALKVIRSEYSESPDFREMFLDEARCASGLSHPNIVHIFDVGESNGLLFMAMELVPGETLSAVTRHLREQDQRFTDESLYAIGIFCASALEAVHSLKLQDDPVNLVHRDVSPHNLLLSSRGSLKLIDFGIAKAVTNRNLTSPGVTKGKAGYFSPEQAMGKPLDGRSDLFSLGVTLYKLAYGFTPFDAHTTHSDRNGALVRGQWEPLHKVQAGLSQGLYDVVERAMQLKPDDRYATAAEMREALEQAAFATGIRIGANSLLGYVTDDGAITAVPTGSRPAVSGAAPTPTPAPVALPPPPSRPLATQALPRPSVERIERDRMTDRLVERTAERRALAPRWGRAAAFAGALVVGVGATWAALQPKNVEKPPEPARVVQTPVAPEPATPTPTPAPEPVVEEDGDATTVEVEPLPAPLKAPVKPVRRPKHVEAAPAAEVIPAGKGTLRINVQPASLASRAVVGRDDWGPTPVNKRIDSGQYVVSVRLPDGKKSPEWKGPVMPDVTTVLIYDADTGRWQKR